MPKRDLVTRKIWSGLVALIAILCVTSPSGCSDDQTGSGAGPGSIRVELRSPENFVAPFCVAIQASGGDFSPPIRSEQTYPVGTMVIETVLPNIPVGQDRTIELGIFKDGTCDADFTAADWYGRAAPVEIRVGDVTIVQIVLQSRSSQRQTGSVVIRAGSFESKRLHVEVVDSISTPIDGAQCEVFSGMDPLGTAVSGSDPGNFGVIDTDLPVPPGVLSLRLECTHPNYAMTIKEALWTPDPASPDAGTFIATVIMKARVEILTSTPEGMRLRVNLPRLKFMAVPTPEGEFQRVVELDSGFTVRRDSPSQPEVPVYTALVALPIDGKAEASVAPEGEGDSAAVRLYPIQPDHRAPGGEEAPAEEELKFIYDAAAYDRGNTSIADVRQRPLQQSGDGNVLAFEIPIVNYFAGQRTLTQFSSLLIDIKFSGNACFRQVRRADGFEMDAIDTRIESIASPILASVLNRNVWASALCPIIVRPLFFGARFIIVTPPSFTAAANDLAAHKRALGLSTVVVSTTTTGTTAASIRAYLENAYNSWWIRPKYVLLLGDSEFIPTHYPGANNTWDGVKNGGDQYYGQFGGGTTSVPLIGIGRFPVDTNDQAQVVVDKVKAFENAPPSFFNAFYNNYSFAAQFQDDDTNGTENRTFARTAEVIRSYVAGLGWTIQRIYDDSPTTNPTTWYDGVAVPWYLQKPTFPWNGSTTDVTSAFNDGRALFFHRDHGWWTGWGTPSFSTGNLSSVSVAGHEYPFVLSVNCASGIFDNESSETSGSGYSSSSAVYWAETFLRKSDGALAVIGDQRSSGSTINSDLAKGLFDAMFPGFLAYGSATPIRKLGDVLNAGKGYLTSLSYSSSDLGQEMTLYNLLGDPTITFRTRGPLPFVVTAAALTNGLLRAFIPLPEPIPNPGPGPCLTCPQGFQRSEVILVVQDLQGNVLGRGFASGDGSVSVELSNNDVREVMLTASSEQGMPTQIVVKAASN